MQIRRYDLSNCEVATGVVVVVDVLRAFTTAAWALHRGAAEICLATTVAEAFSMRARRAGAWIVGESGGLPVPGFDLPNSPAAVGGAELRGRCLVQRTSTGTQGACRVRRADRVFAASLTVAGATADRIRALSPATVSFVATGAGPGGRGDEDTACADYIAGLLLGEPVDRGTIRRRVQESAAGRRFADVARPEFPAADLALALEFDRFDFALAVRRRGSLAVLCRA